MWRMQVKTYLGWQDIHPSGCPDKPYEYTTQNAALQMLSICYPNEVRQFVYGMAEQTVRVKYVCDVKGDDTCPV